LGVRSPQPQNYNLANLTLFRRVDFSLKVLVTRGSRNKGILRLKRKTGVFYWGNGGLKVLGGVALFRDPPLPVPLDARFTARVLEVGELMKTLFERCRFLLPVSTYEGLKFSEGGHFGGKLLPT